MKAGKASGAGSGFGGKGLEKLDQERDASSRAERAAYGETPGTTEPKIVESTAGIDSGSAGTILDPAELEVEIRRGPAPDSVRKGISTASDLADLSPAALAALKVSEAAAIAQGFVFIFSSRLITDIRLVGRTWWELLERKMLLPTLMLC